MTTLTDGQYAYRDLVFGLGTEYPLTIAQIEGLESFTARVGDQPLPRGHGDVPGKHFLEGLEMLAPFVVYGDREVVETKLATLRETFGSAEDTPAALEYKKQGQPQRLVYCRPVAFTRGDTREGTRAEPKVALRAADPRLYSAEEHQLAVPLYTAGGGAINYPVSEYPKNYPEGVALEAVATNAGTADAYPTLRFYGPSVGTVTAVTVTNMTTDEDLTITTSILSGQILTFDGSSYVTGNGGLVVGLDGSSRYGSWEQPREPLRLAPGDNVLRFQITGTATAAPLIVTWRDTWLS